MPLEKLTITKAISGPAIPRAKISRAVEAACSESKKAVTLHIIFVSDKKIANLHFDFMRDSSATDVITFVLQEEKGSFETEIYVSIDRAKAQARENGVTLPNELVRLSAHGALHAIGYDDLRPRLRAKMWKRQESIVAEVFTSMRTASNTAGKTAGITASAKHRK